MNSITKWTFNILLFILISIGIFPVMVLLLYGSPYVFGDWTEFSLLFSAVTFSLSISAFTVPVILIASIFPRAALIDMGFAEEPEWFSEMVDSPTYTRKRRY